MEWIEKLINDEEVFPVQVGEWSHSRVNHYRVPDLNGGGGISHTLLVLSFSVNTGTPFPKNFLGLCKKLLTRLYRVFVHVYIHHFDKVQQIGAVRGGREGILLLYIFK